MGFFSFFDFSYVGIVVSFLSIVLIGLISRFLVKQRKLSNSLSHLIDLDNYLFEFVVSDSSSAIGMTIAGFVEISGKDTEILGIVNENGSVSKSSE